METPKKFEANVHSPLTGGHRWNDWLAYAQGVKCIAEGIKNVKKDSLSFAEQRLYWILNEIKPIKPLQDKSEDYKKFIENLTDENEILRLEHYNFLIDKMLEALEKIKEICANFKVKSKTDFKNEEVYSYEIVESEYEEIKKELLEICKILDEVSEFLYDEKNTIEADIAKILG